MDQLSLVMSSGSLGLPHEEGACLSLVTENEQKQDLLQR